MEEYTIKLTPSSSFNEEGGLVKIRIDVSPDLVALFESISTNEEYRERTIFNKEIKTRSVEQIYEKMFEKTPELFVLFTDNMIDKNFVEVAFPDAVTFISFSSMIEESLKEFQKVYLEVKEASKPKRLVMHD